MLKLFLESPLILRNIIEILQYAAEPRPGSNFYEAIFWKYFNLLSHLQAVKNAHAHRQNLANTWETWSFSV